MQRDGAVKDSKLWLTGQTDLGWKLDQQEMHRRQYEIVGKYKIEGNAEQSKRTQPWTYDWKLQKDSI